MPDKLPESKKRNTKYKVQIYLQNSFALAICVCLVVSVIGTLWFLAELNSNQV